MKAKVASGQYISYYITAVVLSICLSGCGKDEIQKLTDENNTLNNQIQSLKQDIAKLKETADYHYQQGIDYLAAKEFEKARAEFQTVLDKFPVSPLGRYAQQGIAKTKLQLSNIEQERRAEQRKLKVAAEREARLKGEEVSVDELKINSSAYDGKSIRVTGLVSIGTSLIWNSQKTDTIKFSFDDMSLTDKKKMTKCNYFNDCSLTVIGAWSSYSNELSAERIEQ